MKLLYFLYNGGEVNMKTYRYEVKKFLLKLITNKVKLIIEKYK